jgi:hypothetical protein
VPIAKLFVEGALDVQVLSPILLGNPVPQLGGSKNSLKPRALAERRENRVAAGYLRDRDFDFDPPADVSRPTVDNTDAGVPFGWRWCRHEIENYLIDPSIVSEATNWPLPEVEESLRDSARKIRIYQAARWTIGVVRRALPPHYELRTRPDGLNEIELPPSLEQVQIRDWATETIKGHRAPMAAAMDPAAVKAGLDMFDGRFDDAFIDDVAQVLIWFSGKDILAGMADWLAARSVKNPGAFRALTRDWMIANPERTVDLLPEWKAFVEAIRL